MKAINQARYFVVCGFLLLTILAGFSSLYYQHHQEQQKAVQAQASRALGLMAQAIYYADRVNGLTEIQDKYECARDGKPYVGVICNSNSPDAQELAHFGPEFFSGIRDYYAEYQQKTLESINELYTLVPYEGVAYQNQLIAYQTWFLGQMMQSKLGAEDLKKWQATLAKDLGINTKILVL